MILNSEAMHAPEPVDELHLLALRAINALPPARRPARRVRLYCWEAARRSTGVNPRSQ